MMLTESFSGRESLKGTASHSLCAAMWTSKTFLGMIRCKVVTWILLKGISNLVLERLVVAKLVKDGIGQIGLILQEILHLAQGLVKRALIALLADPDQTCRDEVLKNEEMRFF